MTKPAWTRATKPRRKSVKTQKHHHRWAPVRGWERVLFRCKCGEIGYPVPRPTMVAA